jgi:hypothetical protein
VDRHQARTAVLALLDVDRRYAGPGNDMSRLQSGHLGDPRPGVGHQPRYPTTRVRDVGGNVGVWPEAGLQNGVDFAVKGNARSQSEALQ